MRVLKWILRVAGIPLLSAIAGIIKVEFDSSAQSSRPSPLHVVPRTTITTSRPLKVRCSQGRPTGQEVNDH